MDEAAGELTKTSGGGHLFAAKTHDKRQGIERDTPHLDVLGFLSNL